VVHSDFVFAAVAEEWGLVGSLGLVAVFMLLAYRGMRQAMLNRRPFRSYLAAGITLLFSVQALLIMGGVTKLLPLTGVTLPFISYGGSSFLISSIMLGAGSAAPHVRRGNIQVLGQPAGSNKSR
jgi:cell division protein FtsW